MRRSKFSEAQIAAILKEAAEILDIQTSEISYAARRHLPDALSLECRHATGMTIARMHIVDARKSWTSRHPKFPTQLGGTYPMRCRPDDVTLRA